MYVEDGKVLLVRQYRYAYGESIYEIPAGKLEKGEDPMFAAMRDGSLTIRKEPSHFEEYVFQTPFTAMVKFYDFFVEEYGSVRNYLLDIGVKESTLAKLEKKFIISV